MILGIVSESFKNALVPVTKECEILSEVRSDLINYREYLTDETIQKYT